MVNAAPAGCAALIAGRLPINVGHRSLSDTLMIVRTGRTAIVIAALALPAGCTAVSDLNPFDRGSTEPLPPVQGNVIATSSSRNLATRIGTTSPSALPGAPAGPTITGQAGTSVEECRQINSAAGTPGSTNLPNGVDPDNCVRGTISTN